MEYKHQEIEKKWRDKWATDKTYAAKDFDSKPKYYVLDMFPYPSGAGLHVGHPLGYIASDIYARYKRHQGFNVLHPMGYDSFGLPAEQYAIQTGQHPEKTTETNVARYREQLDKIGFSFDWDREVRTSNPDYYKWTQWIFKQLFLSYYDTKEDKAKPIAELIAHFEKQGNEGVSAHSDYEESFSAEEWKAKNEQEKEEILSQYRITFLADSWVNWCPALGTVLANDEIKDGVSERGGHPVEQKLMRQWSMRITAYAERLLQGLDKIDFPDSLKEQQRNWIGKSKGASVVFDVDGHDGKIEVFTTRPDTIYGVSFMVLAPEHQLVNEITSADQKAEIDAYVQEASLKTERDRQADVKNITGAFTGAYAIHPFSGEKIPVWIGDYVLASYGTGAVMAVPCGDQRDWDFAQHFGIEIKNIFKDQEISEAAYTEKDAIITNSDFLNDLPAKKAIGVAIKAIEEKGIGKGKTNYRLRDAVFSRQRYWGEPFPIYIENGVPKAIEDEFLPIELPEVDKYLPTEDGDPPLGNAENWSWCRNKKIIKSNDKQNGNCTWPMELNTMPGWAGSSWYYLRYMDPHNEDEFVSKEKAEYWGQVDLYIGGAEHATGHLLYSRFWCKFLYDMGYISFDEPFKKLINQGMILGRSSFVYRDKESGKFVTFEKRKEYKTARLHADISLVNGDKLDIEAFKKWRPEYEKAEFILNDDGEYTCGHEVEKMSKSKYNVQTPDELVERYGADTLRCYEMFLGPLEQAKPWDVQGINGVYNFLRKFNRLFHDENGQVVISDEAADKKELKSLHKAIKKVTEELDRYSFNTVVSTLMIAVNELTDLKCNKKEVLEPLTVLLSPYAPHLAEELWGKLGHNDSVVYQKFPEFDESKLVEDAFAYPVSFNGKMRFKIELPTNLSKEDIEKEVMAHEKTNHYLEGKDPKKVIVVPKRIVNIVV